MKLSDILKVERRKVYPGGMRKPYYVWDATLLGYTATHEDKEEAVRLALNDVHQQVHQRDKLYTDTSPDGTVWILRYCNGWEYCMRGNGRPNYGSVCMLGRNMTRQQAVAAMMEHKAQYDAG